jgi:hypothetical protein
MDQTNEAKEQNSRFVELLTQLAERCEGTRLSLVIERSESGDPVGRLDIPMGRDARKLAITEPQEARALLDVPFERHRYLAGYEAIASTDGDYIEAVIGPVEIVPGAARMRFSRKFLPRGIGPESDAWPDPIRLADDQRGIALELGQSSDLMGALATRFRPRRRSASFKIRGLGVRTHDDAVRMLSAYSDSLFFQIDARWGIPIQLIRRGPRSVRRRPVTSEGDALAFPRSRYDPEPMSLFWYARSARGMPLLQYLAYYQVIEFYFPVYAEKEVRRRLRNVVAGPAFSPHSDREIGKLVDVMASTGARSVLGDEKSQLRATLRDCIEGSAIRALVADESYSGHFGKKVPGLTDVILRDSAQDDDLVTRTAERIYEIRCMIVHTKDTSGGEQRGLLLPFSPDAERLGPDIDLVELAARSTLIAAGQSF